MTDRRKNTSMAAYELQLCVSVKCTDFLIGSDAGVTNPLIRRGTLLVEKRRRAAGGFKRHRATESVLFTVLQSVYDHLVCWQFSLPQGLNLLGSVLFARALKDSQISLAVPLTNGTSIVSTAVVDFIIGEGVPVWPGVPGVVCLGLGVALCSTV